MIGDTALIHPLCGNGMAMAIHSAVSELIGDYFNDEVKSRTELEKRYFKMEINFSKVKKMGRL
jgi:hypothetical protein